MNRGTKDASGPQLAVDGTDTRLYYDCYHGVPLTVSGGSVAFAVEAGAFGCVLATPNRTLSPDTAALLATMRSLAGSKLNDLSRNWTALQQTMVPIPPTVPHQKPPQGMVEIPAVEVCHPPCLPARTPTDSLRVCVRAELPVCCNGR